MDSGKRTIDDVSEPADGESASKRVPGTQNEPPDNESPESMVTSDETSRAAQTLVDLMERTASQFPSIYPVISVDTTAEPATSKDNDDNQTGMEMDPTTQEEEALSGISDSLDTVGGGSDNQLTPRPPAVSGSGILESGNGQVVPEEGSVTLTRAEFTALQHLLAKFRNQSSTANLLSTPPTSRPIESGGAMNLQQSSNNPTVAPGGTTTVNLVNSQTISSPAVRTNQQVQVSNQRQIATNALPLRSMTPEVHSMTSSRLNSWTSANYVEPEERSMFDGRMALKMPNFSGKVEDYPSWKNRFHATVSARKESYAVKFMVLVDCTSHLDALSHFQHWTAEGNEIEEAFQFMDTIYGNPGKILDAMIKKLNDATKVYKEENVQELLKLQAQFNALVTTAKKMTQLELYRVRICEAVMMKLPRTCVDKICREDRNVLPAIETIQRILKDTLEVGLRSSHWQAAPKIDPKQNKKPFRNVGAHHVDSVEHPIESTTQNVSNVQICPFDGAEHSPIDCMVPHGEKMKIIRKGGLCLNCLRKGHISKDCWSKIRCGRCNRAHHETICFQQGRNKEASVKKEVGVSTISIGGQVFYKCFMLDVGYGQGRAFVDEGAGFNFIESSMIERLRIPTIKGPAITALGLGRKSGKAHTNYVWLTVKGRRNQNVQLLFCVIPKISYVHFKTPPNAVIQKMPADLRREYWDDQEQPVEMLIGICDYVPRIEASQLIEVSPTTRLLVQTSVFGTTISGGELKAMVPLPVNMTLCSEDLLREDEAADAVEVDQFVQNFLTEHVRTTTGRIEVDMPMTGNLALDSNRGRSLQQMLSNVKRWKKNGTIGKVVDILREWETNGIIEPITEADSKDGRYHVLSYHTVIKLTSATTKVRLVFNGSLKDSEGRTLNDYLFKGHTTWGLVKSLSDFRLGQYPLVGDIRQAFLMVQLSLTDRNMFCFFWPSEEQQRLYRFARVPFGTSASPFLLYAALLKIIELEQLNFPSLHDLIRRFYVDDLVTSFDSRDECQSLKNDCIDAFNRHGMKFGWSGNDICGVLGLKWDPASDLLSIKMPDLKNPRTVRDLARLIPSVFDPSGWLEPVMSALRRSFSDAWKATKDWDADIPEKTSAEIEELVTYLQSRDFTVPRWTGCLVNLRNPLYVFTDANGFNIGLTVYTKLEGQDELRLVFAKSILKRKNTVAEAELNAILLASKLIHKHFDSRRFTVLLWTDSKLNYYRLHTKTVNDLKYRQAIKVMAIREFLQPYQPTVHHVVGTDNSADLMTKFEVQKFNWDAFMTRPLPIDTCDNAVNCFTAVIVSEPEDYSDILKAIEDSESLKVLTTKYTLADSIKAVQWQAWSHQLKYYFAGKIPKQKSDLGDYYYEIKNGLLHTRVRNDVEETRIVLPTESRLVHLIWKYEHLKRGHMGVAALVSLYKSVYFTKQIRKLFNLWAHSCMYCANKYRRPVAVPAAPLPSLLCKAPARVFLHCGTDFAGPFQTSAGEQYIMMITCLHSRAVHLQLLPFQDSHSIHCAFRIFVAKYGTPSTMYSDNGPPYTKANSDIQALYDLTPDVIRGFNWSFSLPGEPSTNGINEVMIGLTKKALKGFQIPTCMSATELLVFVAEAEAVVNNRPLYVYNNELITPNHFILGRTTMPMLQPIAPSSDPHGHIHVQIRKRVRAFWNSWLSGYLDRRRDLQQGRCVQTLKEGDHVLWTKGNMDERGFWPLGKVLKVNYGQDGSSRSFDIQLDSGKTHLRRSPDHLIHFSSLGAEAVAALK